MFISFSFSLFFFVVLCVILVVFPSLCAPEEGESRNKRRIFLFFNLFFFLFACVRSVRFLLADVHLIILWLRNANKKAIGTKRIFCCFVGYWNDCCFDSFLGSDHCLLAKIVLCHQNLKFDSVSFYSEPNYCYCHFALL